MDAKDIRKLLAEQRNQKFRKATDNQIDGLNKVLVERVLNGWHEKNAARYKDPEFKAKHNAAVAKANKRNAKSKEWHDACRPLWNSRKTSYTVEGIVFETKGEAIEHIHNRTGKVTDSNVLINHPHLYYKTEDGPGAPKIVTIYKTEYGEHYKLRALHKWLFENGYIDRIYANVDSWWRTYSKKNSAQRYAYQRPTTLDDLKEFDPNQPLKTENS